jgi:SAM-dependent methyltransferase
MSKVKSSRCLVCKDPQQRIFKYQGYEYWRCIKCGLVSTLPFPKPQAIEDHYREKFNQGNYKLLRRYATKYKSVYRGMAQIIREAYKQTSLKNKTVLDIGCFTGEFLEIMQEYKTKVYGVELQAEAVKNANQKFPGKIIKADVLSTDFPKLTFDIVTMLGLVEHLVNPQTMIKKAYQLLKPNGLVMIQTPNSNSVFAQVAGRWWPPYTPVEHIHLFSRKSLERLLTQNGFKNIQFRTHWKSLPVAYVYANMQNFSPELYRLLKPLDVLISKFQLAIPFYGGEMIVTARK